MLAASQVMRTLIVFNLLLLCTGICGICFEVQADCGKLKLFTGGCLDIYAILGDVPGLVSVAFVVVSSIKGIWSWQHRVLALSFIAESRLIIVSKFLQQRRLSIQRFAPVMSKAP